MKGALHGDSHTSAHKNVGIPEEAIRTEAGNEDGGDNDAKDSLALHEVDHADRNRTDDSVSEKRDGEVSSRNLVPLHVEA